jgi:4-amino-4-deoxy-L-arabinose transferase-like glycosyltransferase
MRSMERSALLGIMMLALAIRLAVAWGVQARLDNVWQRPFVIAGDADGYWELAARLARGEPYAIHTPPRYAMRMPGYPLFLASIIRVCGESHFAARLATAVMGTLCVGLVYLLGKTLFSSRVGLAGALLAALSPYAAGMSVLLLSETLFSLMLLLNLWCFAAWFSRRTSCSAAASHWWAAATGATVALATYVRPTWWPAGLAMGAYVCWREVGLARLTLPAMIGGICLLCLLPWAIRNHRVTGHWVWTTLWMGPSLYDGLNQDADGSSRMDFFDRESVMATQGLSEFEMNRHYRDRAIAFVRANPGPAMSLIGRHALRYWSPWPNAEQFRSTVWLSIALAGFTIPLFLLALYGATRAPVEPWKLGVCMGPILAFAVIHSIFVGSIRYRLPAEFPLSVLAGVGMVAIIERCSRRGDRSA